MSEKIIYKCKDTIGRDYYKLMKYDRENKEIKFVKQLSKKELEFYTTVEKLTVREQI